MDKGKFACCIFTVGLHALKEIIMYTQTKHFQKILFSKSSVFSYI